MSRRAPRLLARKPTKTRKLRELQELPESIKQLITALAEQAVREFLEEEKAKRPDLG